MPTIVDQPPQFVQADLDRLETALNAPATSGGVPKKAKDQLLVATWNIRGLGRFTAKWQSVQSDSPKRDLRSLRFIAAILERFDVVAIQELKDYTLALREILRWLNRSQAGRWDIVVSDVTRGDAGNRERLGYLYDTRKVRFSGLAGELVIPFEQLSEAPDDARRQFARTPYAVSFRASNGNNFILTSVHVNYSVKVLNEAGIRRIADWVEEWVTEPHVWDTDILVLGDFNADRIDNPAYGPFAEKLHVPFEMMGFPRTIYAAGKDKHYDLITWPVAAGGGAHGPSDAMVYGHRAGYFDFQPHVLTGMSNDSLSWRVSDHYPLWVVFGCA